MTAAYVEDDAAPVGGPFSFEDLLGLANRARQSAVRLPAHRGFLVKLFGEIEERYGLEHARLLADTLDMGHLYAPAAPPQPAQEPRA